MRYLNVAWIEKFLIIWPANLLDKIASRLSTFQFAFQYWQQIDLFWFVSVHPQVIFCHIILQLCLVFSTFVFSIDSISYLQNISSEKESYILSYTILILIVLLLIVIFFLYWKNITCIYTCVAQLSQLEWSFLTKYNYEYIFVDYLRLH